MSSKSRENHNRLHDRDPGPVTLSNQGQDKSYLEPDFNEKDDQTPALMSQEATTEHNPEFSEATANADHARLQATQSHDDPDPMVKVFNTRSAKKDVATTIFIGLAGAILGMLGHHFFLSYLDGRIVEGRWQFWSRNASNAFSQVVVMFMGLVVASLLTQAIWREVTQKYTQIAAIDHCFSLPSPISTIALVYKRPASMLSLPLALSVLVQSLVIVSILAPNSLSLGVSGWNNITTATPILDFANVSNPVPVDNVEETFTWAQVLVAPSLESYWDPPPGCEVNCSFSLEYQAPALSCHDLAEVDDEKIYPHLVGVWTYYYFLISYPTFWTYSIPHTAKVINNGHLMVVNQTAPTSGLQCEFLSDGSYRAAFEFADGIKSVTTTLISSSPGSIQACVRTGPQNTSYCNNYSNNTIFLSNGFVPVGADLSTSYWQENGDSGWGTWGLTTEADPILSTIMRANFTNNSSSLSLTTPNPGLVLEDLFSNITLKAILSNQQTKSGAILSSNGKSVWRYAPHTLWIIYGVALALLLLVSAIYGQYSIFGNGISMNKNFSTVLMSTHNKDMDKVCSLNFDKLMGKSLRFNPIHSHFDVESEPFMGKRLHVDKSLIPSDLPNSWARGIMITAFLTAILLSAGHHLFLSYLNGQKVSLFSQFWMKNISNGFAQATTLCLQIVVAYSLTQTVWQILGGRGVAIATINHLFSLPSPDASIQLFAASWFASLMPAAFLVWTTYVLPLVSTLAPNALTASSSTNTPVNLTIPVLDYSGNWLSTMWDNAIFLELAVIDGPEQLWDLPAQCGISCEFKLEYEAIGISCIDYPVNNSLNFTDDGFVGYTFIWVNEAHAGQLGIEYFPAVLQISNYSKPAVLSILSPGVPAGSLCLAQDATYQAAFLYSNGTQSISTSLLHYNNSFTDRCSSNQELSLSLECQSYKNISSTLFANFGEVAFTEFLPEPGDNGYGDREWVPVYPGPPLQKIFNFDSNGDDIVSSSLNVPNMSEAVVDLFSNYTLSVMSASPNTATVTALTWGDTVWKFDVGDLWYIYGSAHALTFLALLYGLYCIHSNGKALDNNFVTLMLATRSKELDDIVQNAGSYDGLMKVRLRKEKERYFVVDDDQVDGSVVQRDPESV